MREENIESPCAPARPEGWNVIADHKRRQSDRVERAGDIRVGPECVELAPKIVARAFPWLTRHAREDDRKSGISQANDFRKCPGVEPLDFDQQRPEVTLGNVQPA